MIFNRFFPSLILMAVYMHINRPTSALNMPPLDQNKSFDYNTQRSKECGGNKRHTSNFQAKQNHPTSYDDSPAFKGPIVLERSTTSSSPSSTSELHTRLKHYYKENNFDLSKQKALHPQSKTSTILQTIANHFAHSDAPVDIKEVCESMEFYLRTRKRMFGAAKQKHTRITGGEQMTTSPTTKKDLSINVLDCCAGHGLTGMLFVACNPRKNIHATLIDYVEPPSHKVLRDLLIEVCPWVEERVSFYGMPLQSYQEENRKKSSLIQNNEALPVVIATHACGFLTDNVLELAVDISACGIAAMPCCYTGTSKDTPYGIKRALGVSWAADIRRSFFLTENGYHADFATIPSEITPMNRILVGELRD